MSFLQNFAEDDEKAQGWIRRYHAANEQAALAEKNGEPTQWLDAQIRFRVKGRDGYFGEADLIKISQDAVQTLNALATYALISYNALTWEVPGVDAEVRYITAYTDNLDYIAVTARPHVPEQTDEEIRRSKFRGVGLADVFDERPK